MMQKKEDKSRNLTEARNWLRIVLSYGLTICGIFALPWLFVWLTKLSGSWIIGISFLVGVIPLFPATHAVLLKKKPATLILFVKVYVAQFASLFLQLGFLMVTAPFIAILVAGRLAVMLLITAVIAWFIVGLQQLGLNFGSKMLKHDIIIFLQVTIGLAISVGVFYFLNRIVKKYEDSYFDLWGNQFGKIRNFFCSDTI